MTNFIAFSGSQLIGSTFQFLDLTNCVRRRQKAKRISQRNSLSLEDLEVIMLLPGKCKTWCRVENKKKPQRKLTLMLMLKFRLTRLRKQTSRFKQVKQLVLLIKIWNKLSKSLRKLTQVSTGEKEFLKTRTIMMTLSWWVPTFKSRRGSPERKIRRRIRW